MARTERHRPPNLLIVADEFAAYAQLTKILKDEGFIFEHTVIAQSDLCDHRSEFDHFDLLLVFTQSPNDSIVDWVRQNISSIETILICEPFTEEQRITAITAGIYDVIRPTQHCLIPILTQRIRRSAAPVVDLPNIGIQVEELTSKELDLIDAPVAYVQDGLFLDVNSAFRGLIGLGSDTEVMELTFLDLFADIDRSRIKLALVQALRERDSKSQPIDSKVIRSDGECVPVKLSLVSTRHNGEACLMAYFKEKTAAQRSAPSDPILTGILLGRRQFIGKMKTAFDRSGGETSCVLFINVDRFDRLIADEGLLISDSLLDLIGKLLSGSLPSTAHVCHFSEKIFTAILQGVSLDEAQVIAEEVIDRVRLSDFSKNGRKLEVSLSIGIAEMTGECSEDAYSVLSQSHAAYHMASEAGGNRAVVFKPHLTNRMLAGGGRKAAEILTEAFETGLAKIVYQPIQSLRQGCSHLYESYLRILNDRGEVLDSEVLFSSLQDPECAERIDHWLVLSNLRRLGEERSNSNPVSLVTRLTALSLQNERFSGWLVRYLEKSRPLVEFMIFSIEEHAALMLNKRGIETLKKIKALGCGIAITRFGLSLSPGHLLSSLPVDIIKLSGELTKEISRGRMGGRAKLEELVRVAKCRQLKLIFPYVESSDVLPMLWSCNVDYVQGHFVRPPSTDLNFFIADSNIDLNYSVV